ncbi:hypothetical protein B0H13DRAFT_2404737 [Mycena leptocephala]|nr:hypothetical protein B0H13DRAFT_2404737 [Mycena leptocephala]
MAQSSVSARAYIKGYATFVVFLAILLFTPALIDLYYPQATSVRAAFVWAGSRFTRGFAAFTFLCAIYNIVALFNHTYKWLSGLRSTSPATRPLALEDGTAQPSAPAVTAGTDAATEAPKRSVIRSVIGRIVSLASCSYYFIQQWYLDDIVSLNRSLLENLGSVLLYILRGFEVLFALFLIKVFVVWMEKGSSDVAAAEGVTAAPAPAAPLQILLDNGVPTKEEKEFIQVEKA